ncbi:hypothetical protein WR25_06812 isoform B [Diploscapter pachys]|uniref:Uncharacterized protein n=1 Tax=Diploscapter pachys TaxID=2018661 RepID=A0A2A2LN84_9BILA|nr:hypothetical protein WR25_06812 isoform B [Diploscapter pachys]
MVLMITPSLNVLSFTLTLANKSIRARHFFPSNTIYYRFHFQILIFRGYFSTMGKFSGKVAIITGASSGIGRATAVLMAKDGAKLTITGRNQQELEETAKQTGLSAESLNLVAGDITKHDVQQVLIDTTVNKFGKLDILVNNAGAGFTEEGKIGSEISVECYHKNIEVNLTSVLEMIQKARPHLIKSKGDIVNVSSIAGLNHGNVKSPYYSVAKAGLDQLSRNLALELINFDVRVNSVNPGLIKTNFMERAYHVGADQANKVEDTKAIFFQFLISGVRCIEYQSDICTEKSRRNTGGYCKGDRLLG